MGDRAGPALIVTRPRPAGVGLDEALAEAGGLAKLPRGAYVRTRALARGATLDRIESSLESDLSAAFPAK